MSFVFADDQDSEIVSDMIKTMAGYLSGPGFDGFLAWVDQQRQVVGCDCGRHHGIDAKAIRANLRQLHDAITSWQSEEPRG